MGCVQSKRTKHSDDDITDVIKATSTGTVKVAASESGDVAKGLAVSSIALESGASESGVLDAIRKISMSKQSGTHFAKVSSTLTFWRPSATMDDMPMSPQQPPGIEDFDRRLTTSGGCRTCFFPSSQCILRYSFATVCGWYPGSFHKKNQDAMVALENFGGDMEQVFFGVFDGHGEAGDGCARFAKEKIPEFLLSSPYFHSEPERAFHEAMMRANTELRAHEHIDDIYSGTTAVTALVRGLKVYVANVGDSRCVLAKKEEDGRIVAMNMSNDHTPYREDEMERVKKAGARVLTMHQVEGKKDANEKVWGDEETADEADPPRLWLPELPQPGTAFTRSIGDGLAEAIGVIAEPEVTEFEVTDSTPFFIIATDGVFEFMTSQMVVDMVAAQERPDQACLEIAKAAYQFWQESENRVDDITLIVAEFVGVQKKGPAPVAPTGTSAPARLKSIRSSSDIDRSRRVFRHQSSSQSQVQGAEAGPVLTSIDSIPAPGEAASASMNCIPKPVASMDTAPIDDKLAIPSGYTAGDTAVGKTAPVVEGKVSSADSTLAPLPVGTSSAS